MEPKKRSNSEDASESQEHKLWGGRFCDGLDPLMQHFNASISFDRRMWKEDLEGSRIYAKHLRTADLLSEKEYNEMLEGLDRVGEEWRTDSMKLLPGDEDIHSVNERRLKELIGSEVAGKLHTGRSRNDQVATDMRLWLRKSIHELQRLLASLIKTITDRAELEEDIIIAGYTHLQRGQPVLWSHWLLSYAWMFHQDFLRLGSLLSRTNICPLGSGAIAGNPFNIDRDSLARVHLSRLAEDLVIYSTKEFSFVTISDQFSTGSSLMPQKKNADSLELVRGKTGRLVGNAVGILVVLKGLPSTFNKDMQEDKEGMFDSFDTIKNMIRVTEGVVSTLTVNRGKCQDSLSPDMLATDIAYYLVRRGVSFRDAHEVSGKVVSRAEQLGCDVTKVPLRELQSISKEFKEDVSSIWDFKESTQQYQAKGGTSQQSVINQIHDLRKWMKEKSLL